MDFIHFWLCVVMSVEGFIWSGLKLACCCTPHRSLGIRELRDEAPREAGWENLLKFKNGDFYVPLKESIAEPCNVIFMGKFNQQTIVDFTERNCNW